MLQLNFIHPGRTRLDFIQFEASSPKPIEETDARKAQLEAGWPPPGYGFYSFKAVKLEDGSCYATWKCGNSCD